MESVIICLYRSRLRCDERGVGLEGLALLAYIFIWGKGRRLKWLLGSICWIHDVSCSSCRRLGHRCLCSC
jgi:hypothetical protein